MAENEARVRALQTASGGGPSETLVKTGPLPSLSGRAYFLFC